MLSRTVVSVSVVSSFPSTSPSQFLCKVNSTISKFLGLKGLSHNFTNRTTWDRNLNLNRRCNTRMENFTTKASAQPLKNADELIDSVETFIFDCDGVIWKGDKLIDGVPQTLDMLRSRGKRLVFVTNNSTKSRKQYGKKFETLGLDVSEVYVIGEDGILKELELAGFQYLGGPDDGGKKIELKPGFLMEHDKDVGAVVVGFDRHLNYYKVQYGTLCIRENPGCLFIATNRDAVTHLTDAQEWAEDLYTLGLLKSYISAMSKLIELSVILPNSKFLKVQLYANVGNKYQFPLWDYGLDYICKALVQAKTIALIYFGGLHLHPPFGFGILKSQICMVGDRLDTDILFGQNGGCKTLLVLSGVTSLSMLQSPSNSIQPDFYTNKISDFLSLKAAAVDDCCAFKIHSLGAVDIPCSCFTVSDSWFILVPSAMVAG
ncbi:hypothetical protein DKX38_016159 [Salix brachista]|uniref:phosphoglycolate phosphatase n=1 Tax=Salix brachista TaxID=2182728 RepID=A0A5N5L982_9ROSI|nr:hypothetical protein DKX38_016159 [Salix brachista]